MLFKKNPILGCAIGLSMLTQSVLATVSVSPGSAGSATFNSGTGEWEVTINVSGTGSDTSVTVSAGSSDTITYVNVTTQSSGLYKTRLTVDGANNVKSLSKVANDGELWITLVYANAVGIVTANIIDTIQAATGDVYGSITQVNDGSPLAVTQSTFEDGIALLEAIAGNITGGISADREIERISAFYGTIGTNASTRSTIQCDTKIDDIVAEEIYAEITVGTSGNADLNSLFVRDGDFVGSLACAKITGFGAGYGLDIVGGELKADIDHDSNVMASHFRIGGSLDSSADILLPSAGLTKQIIIDGGNAGGDWDGNVKLNGSAISHDANGVYTNTPSSVGYGAVGLAVFRFNPVGSVPQDGATVNDYFFDPEWIGEGDPPCENIFKHAYIRHFGPIGIDLISGIATVYTIERRPAGGGSWATVTSSFDVSTSPYLGGVHRYTDVKRTNNAVWDHGYEYRFMLNVRQFTSDTALVSLDVDGQPRVPHTPILSPSSTAAPSFSTASSTRTAMTRSPSPTSARGPATTRTSTSTTRRPAPTSPCSSRA